jgi:CheY-like chemotaxis protein
MSLVLVVDDDADQCELYMMLLREKGHQVVGAPDGLVALELAYRAVQGAQAQCVAVPPADHLAQLERGAGAVACGLVPAEAR